MPGWGLLLQGIWAAFLVLDRWLGALQWGLWLLASTRRLFLRDTDHPSDELTPVTTDDGPAWIFKLDLEDTADGRRRWRASCTAGP